MSANFDNDVAGVELVYDGQCPICDFYCTRVDVAPEHGRIRRVDAREQSDVLDEITAQGLDIDEGVVVKRDGEFYYGADAVHELAQLSSRRGAVSRVSAVLFRSRAVSKLLYPLLRGTRNLLLKLLGRRRINNLGQPGADRF